MPEPAVRGVGGSLPALIALAGVVGCLLSMECDIGKQKETLKKEKTDSPKKLSLYLLQ